MVVRRGELWWAGFPDPTGSGPGYNRPAVIIQANEYNQTRINTVVVALLTSNLNLAAAPGNVLVGSATSGLPRDSVINVTQLQTIDKDQLLEYINDLNLETMSLVDKGLRIVLKL